MMSSKRGGRGYPKCDGSGDRLRDWVSDNGGPKM